MTDSNITYITMDSFPKSHIYPDRKISLSITKPGTYILKENIIAGSIYAGDDDTVLDFGRQVSAPPFHFGVWSIISIECDDESVAKKLLQRLEESINDYQKGTLLPENTEFQEVSEDLVAKKDRNSNSANTKQN